MKTNALIILALIALTAAYTLVTNRHVLLAPDTGNAAPLIRAGQPAPDFTFTDVNGTVGTLAGFKGKVVILNFWASWCPPCIAEFPALLSLAAAFPDQVVLLAVSSDHDKVMMDRFLSTLKQKGGARATAPNIVISWDQTQSITQGLFGTTRLPETILISPDGVMREKIAGAVEWDGPAMKEKIAGFMGKTP